MFFEYLQYSNKRLMIPADKVTIFFSMAEVFCKVFNVLGKIYNATPKLT